MTQRRPVPIFRIPHSAFRIRSLHPIDGAVLNGFGDVLGL